VLQGAWYFPALTQESMDLSAACFERAIALAPDNAEAHRWLSASYVNRWFSRLQKKDLAQAVDYGAQAVALDPTSARCHTAFALALTWRDGIDAAAESYRQALMLNPGDPDVLIELGLHHALSGDLAIAHDFFARAFRLNPLPPQRYSDAG
jgi:Flp pilus assembly protein TadD